MSASQSKSVIYAALAGNAAIAATKFGAALFTGSSAMFSEGVHSLVDTGNQGLLLLGMKQSSRAPTPEHPFGFGLRLYFWAFVVAIVIFGVGAGVSIYEGISKIQSPHPIENAWVNYIVLTLAIVFEGAVWLVAFRAFKQIKGKQGWIEAIRNSKDPTVFTVLFEDTAALAGLVVAFLGIFAGQALGMPVLDGVASLLIGLILTGTALLLAYECLGLLTGESVSPRKRTRMIEIAQAHIGVDHVNELVTMYFGPDSVLVALSLDFDDDLRGRDIEAIVTAIERDLKAEFPQVNRIFIEAQSFSGHSQFSPGHLINQPFGTN
jgi:cation diffusion facilitator family transporter